MHNNCNRCWGLEKLELMQQLSMKPPEVLGCAWVVPLTKVEYRKHFGMSRDNEVEEIAMKVSMDYEKNKDGRLKMYRLVIRVTI